MRAAVKLSAHVQEEFKGDTLVEEALGSDVKKAATGPAESDRGASPGVAARRMTDAMRDKKLVTRVCKSGRTWSRGTCVDEAFELV